MTSNLGVDESVDGFVRDDTVSLISGEPSSDLLRRPALFETGKHHLSQREIAIKLGAGPSSSMSLQMSISGLVTPSA